MSWCNPVDGGRSKGCADILPSSLAQGSQAPRSSARGGQWVAGRGVVPSQGSGGQLAGLQRNVWLRFASYRCIAWALRLSSIAPSSSTIRFRTTNFRESIVGEFEGPSPSSLSNALRRCRSSFTSAEISRGVICFIVGTYHNPSGASAAWPRDSSRRCKAASSTSRRWRRSRRRSDVSKQMAESDSSVSPRNTTRDTNRKSAFAHMI